MPTLTTDIDSNAVRIILISRPAEADRHLIFTVNIFSRPLFALAPTEGASPEASEEHRTPPVGGLKQPAHRQRTAQTVHGGDLVRQGKVARTSAGAACSAGSPFLP